MYQVPRIVKSTIKSAEVFEGETIEQKIERIVSNKEPITDGAPEIFTDRSDGVISAYNIRTDRWEVATDAMDAVHANTAAKREGKADMTIVEDSKKADSPGEGSKTSQKEIGGAETIRGEDAK